jgi:hypothetical protein
MVWWIAIALVLLFVAGLVWLRFGQPADKIQPRPTNTFLVLGNELWRRFRLPLLNFTYWTHLLMGVFFYGAIGVWAELLRHYLLHSEEGNASFLLAMHTTYPAVIGATAMQLMLNRSEELYIRSFAQLISTLFFAVAAVSILAASNIDPGISFNIALVGNLAAALFWWIANALDEGLKDLDPQDATGGPMPPNPASGSTGNTPVHTALGEVKL